MMRKFLFSLLLAVLAPVASATDFGTRYPTGSLASRAQAEAALKAATAEEARIEAEHQAREAACYRGFLVNRCREQVRRDRLLAEREVRRVRLEASDLQRRLDAEAAAERKAEADRRRADEDAERAKRAAAEPAPKPKAGRKLTPEEGERNRAEHQQRIDQKNQALAGEQQRAAERAENVRKYQEKQAEAAKRAEEQAATRKKNEQRRAERRKQMESQEAQREALRKQAEERASAAQAR